MRQERMFLVSLPGILLTLTLREAVAFPGGSWLGQPEEVTMKYEALKVGELAKRTGLTIRTLHHYDEIGLVKPSRHGESGYRLYTADDLARLQQVVSLRRLGFSLEEVRDCLDRPDFSPLELINSQIKRLREQIAREQELCHRLEAIRDHLDVAESVSAEEILQLIERMTMIENYYSPEQLDLLKKRRELVGEERMQQAPKDWEILMAEVRAEREQGTNPTDPKVLDLARRWRALVNEFTGGDSAVAQSLGRLWKEQGDQIVAQHAMQDDPRELFDYIGRALETLKGTG
jgi:MerR family transcriptional regulator, thiopeptide resistance regulator